MAKRTGKVHTRVLVANSHIRQFHEIMDSFAGQDHWHVFTDFLQLTMDGFLSDQTADHPREKHYQEILQQYQERERANFPRLLNCVFGYMRETNQECLSEIWEEYAANANLGQFFTPWHLCQLNADLMLNGVDFSVYTPDKPCVIADPSCGGGRTLMAALKKIPISKMDSVIFHGIDIDSNVCLAAALNMLFFNANSFIVNGNALTMEVWRVYQTVHSLAFGGEILEITDPDEMKRIISIGFNENAAANRKEPVP